MKRRILSLFLALILAAGVPMAVSASSATGVQVHETEDGVLYQGRNGSIEYVASEGGYYLQGVTKDEWLAAVNNALGDAPISVTSSSGVRSCSSSDFVARSESVLSQRGVDLSSTRALHYEKDFTLNTHVTHPFGGTLRVYYVATMEMTTTVYQGEEYAMFVRVVQHTDPAMGSGIYTVTSASSEPRFRILNGGATLAVDQLLQLETDIDASMEGSLDFLWGGVGASVGGVLHIRSQVFHPSASVDLPLINVIK